MYSTAVVLTQQQVTVKSLRCAGWETNSSSAQITKGSKCNGPLVSKKKAAVGNKTHSHPLILSKWQMNKKTLDPKGEAGVSDRGEETKYIETSQKKEISNTQTPRFQTRQKTQRADWWCRLPENTQPTEQLNCSHLIKSPSWLTAASWGRNITGEPNRSWSPVTQILRNPCSHQDSGESLIRPWLHLTAHFGFSSRYVKSTVIKYRKLDFWWSTAASQ